MADKTIYNQTVDNVEALGQTGILITIFLILIPLVIATILILMRAKSVIKRKGLEEKLRHLKEELKEMSPEEVEALRMREAELNYALSNKELSGAAQPEDKHGLVTNAQEVKTYRFLEEKKKAQSRPQVDPAFAKLILWFLGSATFWLVLGTTIGEYVGIKFVAPDIESLSWLSFGRIYCLNE